MRKWVDFRNALFLPMFATFSVVYSCSLCSRQLASEGVCRSLRFPRALAQTSETLAVMVQDAGQPRTACPNHASCLLSCPRALILCAFSVP